MKNILFIHQSTELYGSNKTLLLLVIEFKKKDIIPIVVLPNRGPLSVILEENGIEIIIAPVFKISRKMFGIKNLCSLPYQIFSSIKLIDNAIKHKKIELVYSNTLAVLIGIIYAKKRSLKHVWHIHEIIEKPFYVKAIFLKFLGLKANHKIIYNSNTTRLFWENESNREKNKVVLNGLSKEAHLITAAGVKAVREQLFDQKPEEIIIALVGRINRWKGHALLFEAFRNILEKSHSVKLIFVGSAPPNQETHIKDIQEKIRKYKLEDHVKLIPFQNNIWNIWESIDIAVIPSSEPEPFGLVTVEAMLCNKPVIAANHGGTTEIVVHNETGLLFEPKNVDMLQSYLEDLIVNKEKRDLMGKKGYERAIQHFTLKRYVDEIEEICLNM